MSITAEFEHSKQWREGILGTTSRAEQRFSDQQQQRLWSVPLSQSASSLHGIAPPPRTLSRSSSRQESSVLNQGPSMVHTSGEAGAHKSHVSPLIVQAQNPNALHAQTLTLPRVCPSQLPNARINYLLRVQLTPQLLICTGRRRQNICTAFIARSQPRSQCQWRQS